MASVPPTISGPVFYPESDGEPMADNTRQFHWIQLIASNLQILFADRDDVFTCGNQFWYPVEGHPDITQAPDVYVVFGRPKGDRSSYKQWEEDDRPMQVVFEILSPRNTGPEMRAKYEFYEEHGVEEYYLYDPETNSLKIFLRNGTVFRRQDRVEGFVSPRVGIRFDLSGPELVIRYPDGRPFLTAEQFDQARREAEEQVEAANQRAGDAERQVEAANQRAGDAERQAAAANQRADDAEQRLARLLDLSRRARRGQATAEELNELDRLNEEEIG